MSNLPLKTQEDPRMHRLWNPETRCYLHLSAAGETPDVNLSWIGFAYQAETLRQRVAARSEAWPYVRRGRNEHLQDGTEGEP